MKKLVLAALPLALLAAYLVRVELVAAPGARDTADSADAAPTRAQNSRALLPPVAIPEEERVFRTLTKPTAVDFVDLSVSDAVQFLSAYHELPIRFDEGALLAAKISVDSPVTLKLDQVPFQRTLNLLLIPLDLDWYVEAPGLTVTTRAGPAAAARRRLETIFTLELNIVDHVCELTDAQRQKLELAGRGDIQRLRSGIHDGQAQIRLAANDEDKAAELLRDVEQLQRSVKSGPFAHGSIFRKTLETLLTAEQMVKYNPIRAVLQAGGLVETLERGPDVVLGVRLIGATFADEGLARLKGLRILASLRLDVTEVTDVGVAHLEDLTNLQVLSLCDTKVTDAGVVHLKGLANLQELDLSGTRITAAGLVHLKGLTKLQRLSLAGTQVTDAGLRHLKELMSLRSLDLRSTPVSDDGIADLKRALPKLSLRN